MVQQSSTRRIVPSMCGRPWTDGAASAGTMNRIRTRNERHKSSDLCHLDRTFFCSQTTRGAWPQAPSLERHLPFRRSARHDCVDPRRRHCAHPVRRHGLDNPSRDRLSFFDSRRRAFRSHQLPPSISRTPSIAPRRQKNPRISVQPRGQFRSFLSRLPRHSHFLSVAHAQVLLFLSSGTFFDKATKLANCRSQATHSNAWIVLSSRAWDRASRQSPPRVGHRDWSRVCAGSYEPAGVRGGLYGHSSPESSELASMKRTISLLSTATVRVLLFTRVFSIYIRIYRIYSIAYRPGPRPFQEHAGPVAPRSYGFPCSPWCLHSSTGTAHARTDIRRRIQDSGDTAISDTAQSMVNRLRLPSHAAQLRAAPKARAPAVFLRQPTCQCRSSRLRSPMRYAWVVS